MKAPLAAIRSRNVPHLGTWLVLAGPDGVGKSTVADNLVVRLNAERQHWRPGILRLPSRKAYKVDSAQPYARHLDGPILSTIRLACFTLDFSAGYWLRIRPQTRAGKCWLSERGWEDMRADPERYGLRVPDRWWSILARIAPTPDLTVVLEATPDVIRNRKPELSEEDILRISKKQRDLVRSGPTLFLRSDGTAVDVAEQIIQAIIAKRPHHLATISSGSSL